MNGFDILVLIIIGVSALLAFARGFVREILSMLALVLGILAAIWGLPIFRGPVRALVHPEWLADTVLILALFLLIYIAVRVATGFIHDWVHEHEPLGTLDRTAGMVFGVARGFIVMGLVVLLVRSVVGANHMPKFMSEAKLYSALTLTGDSLRRLAPGAGDMMSGAAQGAADAGTNMATEALTNALTNALAGEAENAVDAATNQTVGDMPPPLREDLAAGLKQTPKQRTNSHPSWQH